MAGVGGGHRAMAMGDMALGETDMALNGETEYNIYQYLSIFTGKMITHRLQVSIHCFTTMVTYQPSRNLKCVGVLVCLGETKNCKV